MNLATDKAPAEAQEVPGSPPLVGAASSGIRTEKSYDVSGTTVLTGQNHTLPFLFYKKAFPFS